MGMESLRPGPTVAGRYEIELELARGGMGVVYRARDRVGGRTVALKRCLGEQGGSDLHHSMLQREYQTLVTLRHPHIIEVYDFASDEAGPYYTMELLDGVDLRAKCPLPWREVCSYLRDVTSSLALLHSRRLLHCDVSVANIRLTGEGRAKLLDFGALASFGRNALVAGAPPTTAPEVLDGLELDARVDLYALGATAYFALTGRHAYPATLLSLLRAAWARGRPRPPSAYASDIPAELDQLVLSLLDLDRSSRPASAAEVMDRLSATAGLAPEHDPLVAQSYLLSAGIVGRERERTLLANRLTQVFTGHGTGAVLVGASGLGKSMLLADLLQRAQVAGAKVLRVGARLHPEAFGTWSALLHEASPGTHARGPDALMKLSETAPVVVAIEDLHEADSDSVAVLAQLAKSLRPWRILLLGTLDPGHPHANRPAMRLLRECLHRVVLKPFDAGATQQFVERLFGNVAAAQRLGTFLHDHAAGNPRACAEIVTHLVEQGTLRYAEGTWVLPNEMPAVEVGAQGLGVLTDGAFEERIAHFGPALRAFAFCISPQRRAFDLALCQILSEDEPALIGKDLLALLHELVREGVLVEEQGSYAFARPRVQQLLYARLTPAQRVRQHARLAATLARVLGNDPRRGFEIGCHWLLAGNENKAQKHINQNVEASFLDPDLLVESVPDLHLLAEVMRGRGASDDELQFIEGILVVSGFYLDPSVHDRLAPRCVPRLHQTMGFALASRLAPYLSRPFALAVGVLWAFLRSKLRRPYLVSGASFFSSMLIFVGVCASLSGGACFRLERGTHDRLRELFDVARGLGRYNSLRMLYDLFGVGRALVQGRFTEGQRGLEDQLERLPKIPLFSSEARHQYEAGLHFFIGRGQLLRLGSGALERAQRIDALGGKHDRLMAQLLRRAHYLYRGEAQAEKRAEELFDQLAAQLGSRWIPDLVGVLEFVPYHLTGDVIGLKRTLHRLNALVEISPGLATHRQVASAMYEGHRGRPDRALSIYTAIDAELAPFASAIWAAARGHQAECLNALGRHGDALAVCEAARAHLTPDDRINVFAYLQLERETALALAKLGRGEEAVRLCDALLGEHGYSDNPLVLGLLHADRARIAVAGNDREGFVSHAERARERFLATGNPVLAARAKRLFELGRSLGLALVPVAEASANDGEIDDLSALPRERGASLLAEVAEAVGARAAYLYMFVGKRPLLCARIGDEEPSGWLEAQINSAALELEGTISEVSITTTLARITSELGQEGAVLPLIAAGDGAERQLVGLLIVVDCERAGELLSLDLTRLATELTAQDNAATEVT